MKRRRAFGFLLVIVILLIGRFCWIVTFGNVIWRVHQYYPTAKVYLNPLNTPDPTWGDLVRLTGIRFVAKNEQVGIHISDENVNLDHFRGLKLTSISLTRCRISDIHVILERRPAVAFKDCDVSKLPPDQARFLKPIALHPDTFSLSSSVQ